jgi:excisionase family DNA binding protein
MDNFSEPLADTVAGAAARLSISRSVAYLLIKNGELQALKVRGRTIISRREQERFLATLAPSTANQGA